MILSFDNPNPSKGEPFASLAAVICQRCKGNRIGILALRNRKADKHLKTERNKRSGAAGKTSTTGRNKRSCERCHGQQVDR
jgi:hypothetical protein